MSRILSLVGLTFLHHPFALADGSFNILIDDSSIPPTASGVALADDGVPGNDQLLFLGVGGTGDPALTLSAYRLREALHMTAWELQDADSDGLANGDEVFQFGTSPYLKNSNAAEEDANGWDPLDDPWEPVAGRDGPSTPTYFDVRLTVPGSDYDSIMIDGGVWPDGQSDDPAFGPGNITIPALLDLTSTDPSHRTDRNLTFNAQGGLHASGGINYHTTHPAQPSGGSLNLLAHGGNIVANDLASKTLAVIDSAGGDIHINSFGGSVALRDVTAGWGPGPSGNITIAADTGVLINGYLDAVSSNSTPGDVTVTARSGDIIFPEARPLILEGGAIFTSGGTARLEAFNGGIHQPHSALHRTGGGSFEAEAHGDITGMKVNTSNEDTPVSHGDVLLVSEDALVEVDSVTGGDIAISGRSIEINGSVNFAGTLSIGAYQSSYFGPRRLPMIIGGSNEIDEVSSSQPMGDPIPAVTLRDEELNRLNFIGPAPKLHLEGDIRIVSNAIWNCAPVISVHGFVDFGPGVVVPPTTKLVSARRFTCVSKANAPMTVGAASTLAPGSSPGMALFGSDLAFSTTGELEIEIAGTSPGTDHDQVEIDGDLDLDGTLRLRLLDGYVPAPGQSFTIMTYGGTCTGSFAAVEAGALSVSIDYGSGSDDAVTVTVNSIAINNAPSFAGITSGSVAENTTPGQAVGTLSATDPDAHDNFFWWELVSVDGNPDSGVFTIVGDQLLVGERLNSALAASHEVTARVFDAYGAYGEITGTIDVTPVANYDYDRDGLSREEEQGLGTSDLDRDSDDDLLDDRWESDSGTNPLADDALATSVFGHMPNLVGYAMGYDGLDSDRTGLGLLLTLEPADLSLSFPIRRTLEGLDVILESSASLSDPWAEELRWNASTGWSSTVETRAEHPHRDRATATLPRGSGPGFFRIQVVPSGG